MQQFIRQISVRRTLFALVTAVFVFGIVELICLIGLRVTDATFSLELLRQQQDALAIGGTEEEVRSSIHPYAGWVLDPNVSQGEVLFGQRVPINEFGLSDHQSPLRKRSSDRLLVAITGGSVAWQVSVAGETAIKRVLKSHPELRDREIEIVRLALSGYKQPQQLATLVWLTAMGAGFDVLVNLDGFNEAVLNLDENVPHHVSIGYPRSWQIRLKDVVDPREFSDEFELFTLNARQQKLAQNARASVFRWSMAYSFVWTTRNRTLSNARIELARQMLRRRHDPGGRSYAAAGPLNSSDPATLHREIVEIWARSSLQMRDLCAGRGTRYLHLLQPNQYVPGSKIYSEFETKYCLKRIGRSGRFVPIMYPLLAERGRQLQADGVEFANLSMIFADRAETLYHDDCCHLNEAGYELLGERVAQEIIQRLF